MKHAPSLPSQFTQVLGQDGCDAIADLYCSTVSKISSETQAFPPSSLITQR
ncbi:hypothetical protein HRE53_19855 [Acaryochloris sp. 'Moss Beach']|uniref:hypothetical protein n=1 Tax=Acaryochloris sp. 'Moss Beach' TaxID=2740837 RepID=UPI001F1C5EE0|nr:hypothetical protein [Acaryochloris sp. 'Moss Beach']UJB68721.1 hypothetical protein HRE53_19855 [Acaryochloris sp. 'Moss Beach']